MIEKPLQIVPLAAGQANEVLLLRGNQQSYIFKWLCHSNSFALNRSDEFRLQGLLAETGLAPEVIAFDAKRWVLQQYIKGKSLADMNLSWQQRLRYAARALALVHQQSPPWKGSDIWQKLEAYVARLGVAEQVELRHFRQELSATDRHVLCHFDLSFEHILVADSIRIIDWEYAGWGDRLTDIASAAEINRLDADSAEALCCYYTAETGYTIDKKRFEKHRLFIQWVNRQWQRLLIRENTHE